MTHGLDTGFLVAAEVKEHVDQVFPNAAATQQFLAWLQQFSLGRKRLLDTLLAATYQQAGIQSVLTTNATDFAIFGVFHCTPANASAPDS
ncbi:MAG: hypothetical protein GXY83_17235 [Rhodopirellula sp.]|nr:hypothetical protein [Rhodopirellula sp.]